MRKIGIALAGLISLTACTASDGAGESSTQAQTPTQSSIESQVLTVWVDAELTGAFEAIGDQLNINSGHSFNLVEKDFFTIRSELESLSAAEVPDIFVGSNDQLDEFLAQGLIAPVSYPGDFKPQPGIIRAFSRAGQTYAVPYATENIALVCDSSRVSRAPSDWTELTDLGVIIPLSPGGDPYLLQSFLSSFGSQVFATNEAGDYTSELAIGDAAGIEFASWLRANSGSFVELDYTSALGSLSSGATACILTGPWALAALLETVSFELAAYPLPAIGGFDSQPFGASRGVFVSAQSTNLEAASEALSLIATPASQLLIYLNTGRTPVVESFSSSIESSLMRGLLESARTSVPIPAANLMQYVWGPLGSAQMAILKQGGDPVVIWDEMTLQIQTQIGPKS
jgi:arabinogalactan oligomer/maltooligosaccharide transport system substrate-binding protein